VPALFDFNLVMKSHPMFLQLTYFLNRDFLTQTRKKPVIVLLRCCSSLWHETEFMSVFIKFTYNWY